MATRDRAADDDPPFSEHALSGVMSRRNALVVGVGSVTGVALTACGARSFASPASASTPSAPVSVSAPQSPTASGTATPQTGGPLLMFIRHAEKPASSGAPFGVLRDGTQDADSLIVTGWQRAGALVELFDPRTAGAPGAVRDGLARPDQVVAADPASGSKRPAQTATPLAARLGATVETTWAKSQTAALAASLATRTGAVMVCWEHELIPQILSHLGPISPTPPSAWPDDRFDLVWCVSAAGSGSWTFTQVPQLLLAGDRDATV